MIHRGELVLKIITQKNINKTALAKKIGISRVHLYNHLDNAFMPAFMIAKIGEIIGYDFTKLIPDIAKELDEIYDVNNPSDLFDYDEVLNLHINLDGKKESLERLFIKLTALNDTLKKLSRTSNV
jgi:hypothetical protein